MSEQVEKIKSLSAVFAEGIKLTAYGKIRTSAEAKAEKGKTTEFTARYVINLGNVRVRNIILERPVVAIQDAFRVATNSTDEDAAKAAIRWRESFRVADLETRSESDKKKDVRFVITFNAGDTFNASYFAAPLTQEERVAKLNAETDELDEIRQLEFSITMLTKLGKLEAVKIVQAELDEMLAQQDLTAEDSETEDSETEPEEITA